MNKNRRVIALGFFDGVHNGHGALLRRVVDKARELDAVAAAFTFDRSPTAAITGQTVPLLSSVEDRGWLMRSRYGKLNPLLLCQVEAVRNPHVIRRHP